MLNKEKLKPLVHRKSLNQGEPLNRSPVLTKPQQNKYGEIVKGQEKVDQMNKKPIPRPIKQSNTGIAKRQQNGQIKVVTRGTVVGADQQKPRRQQQKTIELYECNDFELELQDNTYFEHQLQRNIKTEMMARTSKTQAKTQVVLPKLEGDTKARGVKQLQKQMDQQMSRMYESQCYDNDDL